MSSLIKLLSLCLVTIFFTTSHLYANEEYKIEKEDVLLITVYDEPDLDTKTRVDSEGKITFPFFNNIPVEGLTVRQLKDSLEELLEKDYLVTPHVNVFIEEYHARQVFVMGAVEKPGAYELPREKKTTFLEVISLAGGFKNSAASNGSKIIRKTKDNEDETIRIKVSDITKKGEKEKDVEVLPNDVVFVPDSFF